MSSEQQVVSWIVKVLPRSRVRGERCLDVHPIVLLVLLADTFEVATVEFVLHATVAIVVSLAVEGGLIVVVLIAEINRLVVIPRFEVATISFVLVVVLIGLYG